MSVKQAEEERQQQTAATDAVEDGSRRDSASEADEATRREAARAAAAALLILHSANSSQAGPDDESDEAQRLDEGGLTKWRGLDWLAGNSVVRRQRECRVTALDARVKVELRHTPDGVKMTTSGLNLCGRRDCPMCGPGVGIQEGRRISRAVDGWMHSGGIVVFATLTVRHGAEDDLRALDEQLKAGWAAMTSGRAWVGRKASGVHAFVRVEEIKFGENGWHPHLHVLFYARPFDGKNKADAEREFGLYWADRVAAFGRGVTAAGGERVSVDAQDWRVVEGGREAAESVGAYLTKQSGEDIGHEMTAGDWKKGRSRSLTPAQVLYRAAQADEHAWAWRRIYSEFESVRSETRTIAWSQSFATVVESLPQPPADNAAEHDAAEVAEPSDPIVGTLQLTPAGWTDLQDKAQRSALFDLIAEEGETAASAWLGSLGIDGEVPSIIRDPRAGWPEWVFLDPAPFELPF